MASNYTTNYQLCQWAASDKVLRTEFNEDNAKIDAAIKAVDSRAASGLSGKADQSALNSLKSTVAAQETALDLRNCRFVTGSYTGNGGCGAREPNTLTFPQKPVFVCVASPDYVGTFCAVRGQPMIFLTVGTEQCKQITTWGSKSLTWYNEVNISAPSAKRQLNDTGVTYYYFAILEL